MICDMEEIESADSAGWRRVRCSRYLCRNRKRPINPTNSQLDRIIFTCTGWPRPWEFGDWCELLIWSVTGITKDLYLWAKWRLGFRPKCNCDVVQDSMNKAGRSWWRRLRSLALPRDSGR
jgi:hypothetical protein